MTKISWEIAIKTVSEANCTEHWTKKSARHRSQQHWIRVSWVKYASSASLPCEVTMTRLAPRMCDSDNLCSCFKYIRDEISEMLIPNDKFYTNASGRKVKLKGRMDSHESIVWKYGQERSQKMAVRIELVFENTN